MRERGERERRGGREKELLALSVVGILRIEEWRGERG